MLRVIREAQPRYVVGENVGGLISWSDGLVFEQVCADLEAEGYEVQPFVLPACAVNAPHERKRVWFIAHATETISKRAMPTRTRRAGATRGCIRNVSDAERIGQSGQRRAENAGGSTPDRKREANNSKHEFRWTAEPPICRVDDGFPGGLDEIRTRLQALGNAIVPQVAYQIFKAIIETEKMMRQ
jgi:DNA (cytosine-5)-methyltransferase 1